jgi:hypothetical protein
VIHTLRQILSDFLELRHFLSLDLLSAPPELLLATPPAILYDAIA